MAIAAAVLIALATIPAVVRLGIGVALILYGYLGLMIAYSFWLKNIVIVDVLTLAAGFVLRVAAGAVVVQAERFSPWIYVCMVLLALFLGLGKRRQEIVLLNGNSGSTRDPGGVQPALRGRDAGAGQLDHGDGLLVVYLLRAQRAAQPYDDAHASRLFSMASSAIST